MAETGARKGVGYWLTMLLAVALLVCGTVLLVGGVWLITQAPVWAKPVSILPFALTVALMGFELLIAFIQAFIFALLSALYLSESLEEHH